MPCNQVYLEQLYSSQVEYSPSHVAISLTTTIILFLSNILVLITSAF